MMYNNKIHSCSNVLLEIVALCHYLLATLAVSCHCYCGS